MLTDDQLEGQHLREIKVKLPKPKVRNEVKEKDAHEYRMQQRKSKNIRNAPLHRIEMMQELKLKPLSIQARVHDDSDSELSLAKSD